MEQIKNWCREKCQDATNTWQNYIFDFLRTIGEEEYYKEVSLVITPCISNIIREYYICNVDMHYAINDDSFENHFKFSRKILNKSIEKQEELKKFLGNASFLLEAIKVLKRDDFFAIEKSFEKLLSPIELEQLFEITKSSDNLHDVLLKGILFILDTISVNGKWKDIVKPDKYSIFQSMSSFLNQNISRQMIINDYLLPFIQKFDITRLDDLAATLGNFQNLLSHKNNHVS